MKTASQALKDYLATARELYMADIYTFTLSDGTILRYTSLDRDISYGGYTYTKLRMTRGQTKIVRGLEVDTLSVEIYPKNETVNGRAFAYSVLIGYFDNADLLLERIFFPSWTGTAIGTITIFGGKVSTAEVDRGMVNLSVKSYIELLNTNLPRKIYIPGCQNTLYDNICGLTKADWLVSGEVTGVDNTTTQMNCNLTEVVRYFDLGYITFTSGENEGLSRTVRVYYVGIVHVIFPFEYAPVAGDTFDIYPGCDKRMTTCDTKFSNLANFRGFPFIPEPEVSLIGATGKSPNDMTGKK